MAQPRLVLWDIDHTLIATRGVGREIFGEAFQTATGHHMDDMPEATGHTEPDLFHEALTMQGIEEKPDYFTVFAQAQAEGYAKRAEELRTQGTVLPGVTDAVERLATAPGVVQSVLSGNTRAAATVKLEIFGLANRFELDIGAYGDDDRLRPNLVALAQQRAEAKHGTPFTRAATTLIGDTTRDVQAGHEGGAAVIAVASGRTTEQQLRDAGADFVMPSLADTDALIGALGLAP